VTQISSSDFSSYPFHHVSYLSISLLAQTLPLPHLVYHCFSVDVCFRSRGGCQIDSMIQRQRWMPKWTKLGMRNFLWCFWFQISECLLISFSFKHHRCLWRLWTDHGEISFCIEMYFFLFRFKDVIKTRHFLSV
jgi:hypothetical protein